MNLEFSSMLILLIFGALLASVISMASFILGDKSPDKEKVSVYECGFDPVHNPGEPFSIKFFLIAILFLVFDLEISFLFPWSSIASKLPLIGHILVFLFLIILTLGLVYEWIQGGLEWE
uniref:NADH-ubiquinone oxidoreductase chain 3 n=1 Tax=Cubaia aphrodite TaxID=1104540 RepID=G9ISN6_CUBAP|nr:NADH dehydrogenase subunit 3 [Cubaia aphrodite]AER54535.1 NADH dehydrogenase subunit 3 [Cubaia aphrodite]